MTDYKEIFEYPLLSEVILDLRFPTKLGMAKFMPEFQEKIEQYFPKLKVLNVQTMKISASQDSDISHDKVWEFSNPEDQTVCKIYNNKFVLLSNKYTSWNKYKSTLGFKDIRNLILPEFLNIVPIKEIERSGLRFINKIEVEKNNSSWFSNLFIPLFNLKKYSIEDLNENYVRLIVQREMEIQLIIQSVFIIENKKKYYILDLDASSRNVGINETDDKIELFHEVILKEFHSLITEECRIKMRGK